MCIKLNFQHCIFPQILLHGMKFIDGIHSNNKESWKFSTSLTCNSDLFWNNMWYSAKWWALYTKITVGPVYKIKCEECEAMYIGETERSLKARFSEHRRPSSTTSEVAKHVHTDQPEHTVELDNTEILTTESRWFERYNLTPVWDNIIKKRVKAERPRRGGGGGGPRHHRHAQRPLTSSPGQQTDEASSSWWKLSVRDDLLSCDN